MDHERMLIAGGYADAGAAGLYRLRHADGRLTVEGVVAPVCNVPGGVRRGDRWYLVDETAGDIVLLDSGREWDEVARFASGGDAPCHLALNAAGDLLAVANYGNGATALFALDDRGKPVGAPDRYCHDGSGPVADRQEGPHAHWVGFAPDGTLYATDLGSDCVLAFTPDRDRLGTARVVYTAPPGSGPRQIAFHPGLPILYLVSELASTLTVLNVGADGMLVARQTISTLPEGKDRESLAGALLLAGDRLHVTNRGHDSVATFAIEPAGDVRLIGHRASGGVSPRFLLIDGDYLLVAHERSGGVTALPLDAGPVASRADVPGAAFLGETP